jgi:NAD-dependent deacetylase
MKLSTRPQNIVILTGAGISAESGIKTFRDQNGLWENHNIMEVASPRGFYENPELVMRFYNARRKQLLSEEVIANPAHLALGELEAKFSGRVNIVTQNIDDLHERAKSNNIFHMHGELLKIRCEHCSTVYSINEDVNPDSSCQSCGTKGTLRPDIVWFGEMPFHMDHIEELLLECDLFICIGTSGQVYPAASFIDFAKEGKECVAIEINKEETQITPKFDYFLQGNASDQVPMLVHEILHQKLGQ